MHQDKSFKSQFGCELAITETYLLIALKQSRLMNIQFKKVLKQNLENEMKVKPLHKWPHKRMQ